MLPRPFVLLLMASLAIGAVPLLLVSRSPAEVATAVTPWYKTGLGWLAMAGLLWTAVAGLFGALFTAFLAIRNRSVVTLAIAIAIASGTIYLVRLYFRALF